MKIKKLIAGLMAITIVLGAGGVPGNIGKDIFTLSVNAYDEDYDGKLGDLYYTVGVGIHDSDKYDEETGEYIPSVDIYAFDPNAVNISIPAEIDGYEVTSVSALYCRNIDSSDEGSSKLEVLNIPKTVRHFYGITSTDFANGDEHFCIDEFPNLKEINVDKDNKSIYSVDGVLFEFGEEYSEPGKRMLFYPAGKRDKTFTIPKDVIGFGAVNPIIKTVYYDDKSIEYRYNMILANTYLENLIVPEDSVMKEYFSYDGVIYSYGYDYDLDDDGNRINEKIDKNDISYVLCPSGKKNVKLPNGIKSLSGFDGCKSLESIEIPDSVEYIGDGFKHTPLLDNQKGPVKYVGKWAISCDSDAADKVELKSDTIGISNGAFTNCKMKELVIPKSVKYIGGVGIVFGGELEKVEILNPDVEIRSFAFSGSNVKELILPMGMKEIGEAAFANYDGTSERFKLKRITIPDGVTSIGTGAFYGCQDLKEINIPESVTEIGTSAFQNTKWLENKQNEDPLVVVNGILINGDTYDGDGVLPDTIEKINDFAFWNQNITSITLPDTVESIGADAFSWCFNLKSITIPSSVTEIGENAFAKEIYDENTKENIPNPLVISGYKNSAAEKYAKDNGFKFVELKEEIKPDNSSKADSKKDSSSSKPDNSSKKDSSSSKSGDSSKKDDSSKPDNSSRTDDKKALNKGDVNGNGDINVTDIAMVAAHIKGIKPLTDDQQKAADVNSDNEVNVTDIAMIAAHIKGIKALEQ